MESVSTDSIFQRKFNQNLIEIGDLNAEVGIDIGQYPKSANIMLWKGKPKNSFLSYQDLFQYPFRDDADSYATNHT
jgi:hypothetical protein